MNSSFLDSYAALGVPLLTTFGISLILSESIFRRFSVLGLILLLSGWFIFYFKTLLPNENDSLFSIASAITIFSLIMILYFRSIHSNLYHYLSLFYIGGWALIAFSLSGKLEDEKTHYVLISIASIILSFVFLIPRQRRLGQVFDISLAFYLFGWAILSMMVIPNAAT